MTPVYENLLDIATVVVAGTLSGECVCVCATVVAIRIETPRG